MTTLDRLERRMMTPFADVQPAAETEDAELAKKVQLFLSANRRGFSRVSVWAEGETVRLAGPVDSFYLRQMAAVLAKRVAGVRHVIDDLEVDQEKICSQRRIGLSKRLTPLATTAAPTVTAGTRS